MATDLFLTHDWGADGKTNHEKVPKINKALKKLGYVTWFDQDRITGNIKKKMPHGIDNTKCCVVILTERYHDKVVNGGEKDNCQLEFNYASERVPMIAVILEDSMKDTRKWKQVVGMMLAKKLYVDMSGNVDDENYLSQRLQLLVKELLAIDIKTQHNSSSKEVIQKNKVNITDEEKVQECKKGEAVIGKVNDVTIVHEPVPEPEPEKLPLHRYCNDKIEHFYTTNEQEMKGCAGWRYEGFQCKLLKNQQPGSIPLHRYWNGSIKDHFYTINVNEIGTTVPGTKGNNGYVSEGVTGFCYPSHQKGLIPLYRFYHSRIANHFYTTNRNEIGTSTVGQVGRFGYKDEGVACYVFP